MICSKCSHIPQSLLLNHCYGFLFIQLEESIVELAHIIMEHYVSEGRVVKRTICKNLLVNIDDVGKTGEEIREYEWSELSNQKVTIILRVFKII